MKITSIEIEESRMNKGVKIVVFTAENGDKFVPYTETPDFASVLYVVPYKTAWETSTFDEKQKEKLNQ